MPFHHVWSHTLHQHPSQQSLLFTNGLLVPERMTRLTRIDPETGQSLWQARIRTPWGWLAATARYVFYLNQHQFLQCLDLEHGAVLWEYDLGRGTHQYFGHLVAGGEQLLVGGWRGYTYLQCLEAGSGGLLWRYPLKRNFALPLVGSWGLALPCPETGDLLFVDMERGSVRGQVGLPHGVQNTDTGSSIQQYEKGLIATTDEGSIFTLDPAADMTWTHLGMHEHGMRTVTPAIFGTQMIFQDRLGCLCSYDLARSKLNWSCSIHHNRRDLLPVGILPEGQVICGTTFGRLMALDNDGHILGARTISKRVATRIAVTRTGMIVFGTSGEMVGYRFT